MDQRIESFLADVLEDPDAIREGVRVALADCEALFRVREPNKRMRDKAAHACRALCRARVTEELGAGEKLVHNFLDRPGRVESSPALPDRKLPAPDKVKYSATV
jgi:hypothetical protein